MTERTFDYLPNKLDRLAVAVLEQAAMDVRSAADPEAAWAIYFLQKDGVAWFDTLGIALDEPRLDEWLTYQSNLRIARLRLEQLIDRVYQLHRQEAGGGTECTQN